MICGAIKPDENYESSKLKAGDKFPFVYTAKFDMPAAPVLDTVKAEMECPFEVGVLKEWSGMDRLKERISGSLSGASAKRKKKMKKKKKKGGDDEEGEKKDSGEDGEKKDSGEDAEKKDSGEDGEKKDSGEDGGSSEKKKSSDEDADKKKSDE